MADDLDFETVEKLLTHKTSPKQSPSPQPPTQVQSTPSSTPPIDPIPPKKTSPHKSHKHKKRHSRSPSSHTHRHKRSHTHRHSSSRHHHKSPSTHSSRRRYYSPHRHRSRSTSYTKRSHYNSVSPPPSSTQPTSTPNHNNTTTTPINNKLYDNDINNTHMDKILDEETKRRKELEESRRDDLTVLLLNLNLKADERDIYDFFAEHAGKVRDIQCIKDQRSGRAKGVAYVEFFTQESVIKALALSGQLLKGQPIQVQASQAEKNRAAKAAKIQQNETMDGPMKLFVGGLVDVLSNISPQQLKDILVPFGEIISVDIQRDPYTGRSKGYAFVLFKHTSEAKEAIKSLNNFDLNGCTLKVGLANDTHKTLDDLNNNNNNNQRIHDYNDHYDSDRLDDDNGGLLSGVSSRLLLMQKLQRGNELPNVFGSNNQSIPTTPSYILHTDQYNNPTTSSSLLHTQQQVSSSSNIYQDPSILLAEQQARLIAGHVKNGLNQTSLLHTHQQQHTEHTHITHNIIIHNMFNIHDPTIHDDPDFFTDLLNEAETECNKYGHVVCVRTHTPPHKLDGSVWVKFENTEHSQIARHSLNGRYFAENVIKVEFVTDQQWDTEFA